MDTQTYCWRDALKTALKRNRREAHNRYLQLATLRGDGTPAVRTLVFRGFDERSARVHMVTDARSAKVDEIRHATPGELCWYFTHTREQFRLRGSLSLVGPDAQASSLREDLWRALSDKAREQFYWRTPGAVLGGGEVPGEEAGDGPPGSFLVLSLGVVAVDHLSLRGEPQLRWLSRRGVADNWDSQRVNP
jgi:PPOX class probable FMN-dependent enzyme